MKLSPLPPDQIQPTVQATLAFLSDENVSVPGNMVEQIVSAKSLFRAILQGNVVVCATAEPVPIPEDPEDKPPAAKKKVAKKKPAARKKS